MLPALIGAGASIIGGLFASSAQKKANRTNVKLAENTNAQTLQVARETNAANAASVAAANKANLQISKQTNKSNQKIAKQTNKQALKIYEQQRLDAQNSIATTVKDAANAGINPLTAIKSGQSYAGPQAPSLTSFANVGATVQAAHATTGGGLVTPQVGANTGFAEAVQNAGETIFSAAVNAPDPEREMLEKQLLAVELQERTERAHGVWREDFGYSIPVAVSTSGVDSGPTTEYASDFFDDRPLRAAGHEIHTNDSWSDADAIEQRYGDIASWGYGLAVGAADLWEMGKRVGARKRQRDHAKASMPAAIVERWEAGPPALQDMPPWFDAARSKWSDERAKWGIQ